MINRSREAIDAIGFAEALANPGEGKRLDVMQQYRQSDALALVPSSAMDLRQHYADLIAEYVAAKGAAEDNDPVAERIRDFGEDFEEKFRALFNMEALYSEPTSSTANSRKPPPPMPCCGRASRVRRTRFRRRRPF